MSNTTEVILDLFQGSSGHHKDVLVASNLTAIRTTDTWDAQPYSGAFLLVEYTYSAATDWAATFETSYDNGTTWFYVPEVQAGGAVTKFVATESDAASINIYIPVNAAGCSLMRAKLYSPTGDADANDIVSAKVVLTRGM